MILLAFQVGDFPVEIAVLSAPFFGRHLAPLYCAVDLVPLPLNLIPVDAHAQRSIHAVISCVQAANSARHTGFASSSVERDRRQAVIEQARVREADCGVTDAAT